MATTTCVPVYIPHEDSLEITISDDLGKSLDGLEDSVENLRLQYATFVRISRKFRQECKDVGGVIAVLSETVDHVTRTSPRKNK
jgi:hypothetical protein